MTKIILHKISIVLKLRNPVLDVGEWEKVPVSGVYDLVEAAGQYANTVYICAYTCVCVYDVT